MRERHRLRLGAVWPDWRRGGRCRGRRFRLESRIVLRIVKGTSVFGVGRVGVSSIFDQIIFGGTNFLTAVLVGRFAGASELGTYKLCFSILMLAMSLQRAVLISAYIIVRDRLDPHQTPSMRGTILLTTVGGAVVLAVL